MNKHAPIGIFDSGIGGLTVTHALINRLPNEQIVTLVTRHIYPMVINQPPVLQPGL